jgi:hypothetical protein
MEGGEIPLRSYDLGLNPAEVGAKMRTLSLAPPPKGKGAEILTGSPDEVAKALVSRIREKTGVL